MFIGDKIEKDTPYFYRRITSLETNNIHNVNIFNKSPSAQYNKSIINRYNFSNRRISDENNKQQKHNRKYK